MRLSDLIPRAAADDVMIAGLASDSRDVRPGYLFAALPGTRASGVDFIADAVERGAVAVLAPEGTDPGIAHGISLVTDPNPRRRLALAAARYYGAQPAGVACVTGTNGKTSVADFTRQIWQASGRKAASLGTLGIRVPDGERPLRHTTPDPIALHRDLAVLAADGIDHLALEASSHGLAQHRLDGVRVEAAAFTSFSRDHMDYHADPDAYFATKARLFEQVMPAEATAVLNADDPRVANLAGRCRARGQRVLAYGAAGAELRLLARHDTAAGQDLSVAILGARHDIALPLPGAFQAHNALAALGLALATGVDAADAVRALHVVCGVPGRLQRIAGHPAGADVFVDYAHTPDALEAALSAVRPLVPRTLVVVFGCGGERDVGKRREMGEVAARLADRVIVTDDNPRREDPALIRRAILDACPGAIEIGERGRAIRTAIEGLSAGDGLLVAGKGHEREQVVGDRTIAFDDAEVARSAMSVIAGGWAA
ncbi:MAG: UDP-N-acetylmuramoyl-L-alanyl-D-glutamate--2,6-diaminopimelate ligase [Rhodospirillales bacterium]|nr:UDP-N-acetylmuramoyl-L-alanyl-D-glutamate--2,6-diaminopimelate ligase [Rhodospirillales bacterium]MDE0381167.1 UDP-N-acetylmuramoyl-L-alanyl-D-glutamate--2,6-diaminopimelate ligase [Rhodospirillales bacterium]